MPATLIESNENGKVAYDSLLVPDPTALSVFNNKLSLKIIKVLSETPSCALDVARKLKVHEQKVYYHLKNLERAGVVYTISSERRHGMIAKIYSVVSPVIAAKLFERGSEVKETSFNVIPSPVLRNFFHPFIENGKLNGKIIIGDPYPHGRYDTGGTEGSHISDLLLFLGKFLDEFTFPNYKLDTEITKEDLKDNLILIGSNRTNTVIDKINDNLPLHFDPEKMSLISSKTNNIYRDDGVGVVLKTKNPLNPKKMVLLVGSLRSRGVRSAAICILKHIEKRFANLKMDDEVGLVVQGLDKDGDRIIDEVNILEG
jgi:DNA-binding transcriptional ArsR family regulator